MSAVNIELTTESIWNQEWKHKYIVGYGHGIYIGEGSDAIYISKVSDKEINAIEVANLYQLICTTHNESLATGQALYRIEKPGLLTRWYRYLKVKYFTPEFQYNYPADIDDAPKAINE